MKAKYCSVFRKGFSVYVGQKCINLFCYNFFTSDQYQGTRRLVCSEKCREMRIKQTGYLNGNFKKIKLTNNEQTNVLIKQFMERYRVEYHR